MLNKKILTALAFFHGLASVYSMEHIECLKNSNILSRCAEIEKGYFFYTRSLTMIQLIKNAQQYQTNLSFFDIFSLSLPNDKGNLLFFRKKQGKKRPIHTMNDNTPKIKFSENNLSERERL